MSPRWNTPKLMVAPPAPAGALKVAVLPLPGSVLGVQLVVVVHTFVPAPPVQAAEAACAGLVIRPALSAAATAKARRYFCEFPLFAMCRPFRKRELRA